MQKPPEPAASQGTHLRWYARGMRNIISLPAFILMSAFVGFAGFARAAVVIILSDGLERGEPDTLIAAAERLSRLAHALVWLSPLARDPQYRPETEALRAIAPLLGGFSVDLVARMPEARQWSYHLEEADLYSRPDAMLASPALASDFPDTKPRFLRGGLGHDTARFDGKRLEGVGYHRPHASDHAALMIEFEGL